MRIAIVEDDLVVREMLAEVLRERGHSVEKFGAPDDALAACECDRWGVVLCDVRFSAGVEPGVLVDLAEECLRKGEGFVFMSGAACPPEIAGLVAQSTCGWLSKPFRQSDLLREIAERAPRTELLAAA